MEEDKVQQAMAKKLVEAMDPAQAKDALLRIICGEPPYEAILDDGEPVAMVKTTKARKPRKQRSDKEKKKGMDFGPVPPVGSLT